VFWTVLYRYIMIQRAFLSTKHLRCVCGGGGIRKSDVTQYTETERAILQVLTPSVNILNMSTSNKTSLNKIQELKLVLFYTRLFYTFLRSDSNTHTSHPTILYPTAHIILFHLIFLTFHFRHYLSFTPGGSNPRPAATFVFYVNTMRSTQ
jgi:hypothetical protein